jgi:hypothetical protein
VVTPLAPVETVNVAIPSPTCTAEIEGALGVAFTVGTWVAGVAVEPPPPQPGSTIAVERVSKPRKRTDALEKKYSKWKAARSDA